ncbi:MAG: DNA mismatch endonuclease Vsr [Acidobacteriota bacterium]|nr:DNA mismatch endonuclease Vsr [Acidobacteriota bacterium]
MDIRTPEQRSRNMAAIRSENTKPERLVRSLLHSLGYRFRLHRKDLPGKPDIVLPKYHAVVFVHGCFWHQHGCKDSYLPKSRKSYWVPKLVRNRERDAEHINELRRKGWKCLVLWECELAGNARLSRRLCKFLG